MKILLDVLPGAEGDAAARSLALRLPLQRGSALQGVPPDVMVVWIHRAPDQGDDLHQVPAEALAALRARIERGGRVLLTGPAVALLAGLGLEPELPPPLPATGAPDDGPRGVQPFLDHPLFRRAPGGVLLLNQGGAGTLPGFGAATPPRHGVLTGVEKTATGCVPSRGVLLEHRLGSGRVLSLAAHLQFHPDDALGEHRLRFAGDLVDYLLSDGRAAQARAWPAGRPEVEVRSSWPLLAEPAVAPADLPGPEQADLRASGAGFASLATPAGLLWQQCQGLGEVWFRGVRILRGLRARVVHGERGHELPGRESELAQAPGALWWQPMGGALTRAGVVALADGGLQLCWEGDEPGAELEFEGVLEQALDAPWPPASLAPLRVHRAPDGGGLLWQDGVLGRVALLRVAAPAEAWDAGPVAEGPEAGYRFRLRLPLTAPVRMTVHAATDLTGLATAAAQPAAAPELLQLHLDDAARDQELAWCVRGLLECVLPMRTGERVLLAGFGPQPPAVLGADALWAAEPLLWLGARDTVRETLLFLARHGDPSGRIPQRVGWSGVPQHDAPEPSLLFCVALGAWLDVTGDRDLLRACWPALQRAIRLFEQLDQDGDGVPELTAPRSSLLIRVDQLALLAHGLRAAARVAQALGEHNAALAFGAWGEQLHARLTSACFDAELGTYALGIGGQGVPERSLSPLCAVPVALGLCDPASAALALLPFANPEQGLPWGVRHGATGAAARTTLAHETGLLALAEFRAGRPDAGWSWLTRLWNQVRESAPAGIAAEVRLPAAGDATASAPAPGRSALGHALAAGAAWQGLLGLRSRAGLVLEPTLPAAVARLSFHGLRYHGHVLSGELARGAEGADLLLTLRKDDDALLPIEIAPFFGRNWQPSAVLEGGEPRTFTLQAMGEGARAVVRVALEREVRLWFRTEAVATPEPVADPAHSMRFLAAPPPPAPEPPASEPSAAAPGAPPVDAAPDRADDASGRGTLPLDTAPLAPEAEAEPDAPSQARSLDVIRVVSAVPVPWVPEAASPFLAVPVDVATPLASGDLGEELVETEASPPAAVVAEPVVTQPAVTEPVATEPPVPAAVVEPPAPVSEPLPEESLPAVVPERIQAAEPLVTLPRSAVELPAAVEPEAEVVAGRNGTHAIAPAPAAPEAPSPVTPQPPPTGAVEAIALPLPASSPVEPPPELADLAPAAPAPEPLAAIAAGAATLEAPAPEAMPPEATQAEPPRPTPPRSKPAPARTAAPAAPVRRTANGQRRPAAPAGSRPATQRPAAPAPAPRRVVQVRRTSRSQTAVVVLVVALFTGGGLFAFLQGVPVDARERELSVAVPAVSPGDTPVSASAAPPPGPVSAPPAAPVAAPASLPASTAPVASVHSATPALVAVPDGVLDLELATLVELLGPPDEGRADEDGRCAFRLPDGGLLEGMLADGALLRLRVVPPPGRD